MKKISKSEQVILDILWRSPPLTAAQITQLCQRETPWSDKTVKTFIGRLRDKAAIRAEKRGVYYYSPALTRQEAGLLQAKEVVEGMFGGSFAQMTANFIDSGELNEQDIRSLREYLDSLVKKEGGK